MRNFCASHPELIQEKDGGETPPLPKMKSNASQSSGSRRNSESETVIISDNQDDQILVIQKQTKDACAHTDTKLKESGEQLDQPVVLNAEPQCLTDCVETALGVEIRRPGLPKIVFIPPQGRLTLEYNRATTTGEDINRSSALHIMPDETGQHKIMELACQSPLHRPEIEKRSHEENGNRELLNVQSSHVRLHRSEDLPLALGESDQVWDVPPPCRQLYPSRTLKLSSRSLNEEFDIPHHCRISRLETSNGPSEEMDHHKQCSASSVAALDLSLEETSQQKVLEYLARYSLIHRDKKPETTNVQLNRSFASSYIPSHSPRLLQSGHTGEFRISHVDESRTPFRQLGQLRPSFELSEEDEPTYTPSITPTTSHMPREAQGPLRVKVVRGKVVCSDDEARSAGAWKDEIPLRVGLKSLGGDDLNDINQRVQGEKPQPTFERTTYRGSVPFTKREGDENRDEGSVTPYATLGSGWSPCGRRDHGHTKLWGKGKRIGRGV